MCTGVRIDEESGLFLLIHLRTAVSLSCDPSPCQFPRLAPHPLGHLALFALREKQSAGSWTTSLLQLGQSFFSFHGVVCRLLPAQGGPVTRHDKGTNNYPKMIVETLHLLSDYVPLPRLQRTHNPDGEGLAFIQGDSGTSRG